MISQLEEYKKALAENRQPICIDCNKPLNRITQYLMEWAEWTWNDQTKKYEKSSGSGDSERPIHDEDCQSGNWDFIAGNDDALKLGLDY